MIWSHMTTTQAVALRECFAQLRTPRHRQYWRSAQTHDDDYTCEVFDPTPEEITAIAALMKVPTPEDTMSESPTPGQIAYAAHVHTYCVAGHPCWPAFAEIPPLTQRAWENAAQAVLAPCTTQKETP